MMAAPNPFNFSGPVPVAQFTGRKRALKQVIDRLSNQARESTSIVAADRMGRTSFLRYLTSEVCRAEEPALQPFVPVFYDGQQAGHLDSMAIWKRLLELAKKAYETYFDSALDSSFDAAIAQAEDGTLSTADLEDLFDELHDDERLLLVAIDDFHYLTGNTKLKHPAPFFESLRSLMLRQPPCLVVVVASPRQLQDLWQLGPGGSPFYNIFATVILERFTDKEMDVLLDHRLAGTGVTFNKEDRQLITKYSLNHPMLVQCAAHLLYDCHVNNVSDKVVVLEHAVLDPNGQTVMLQRHLLGRLRGEERVAVDTVRTSPGSLTDAQRALLRYLDRFGAIPPGVNIK